VAVGQKLANQLTELERIFLIITNSCNSRCLLCDYWRKRTKHFLPVSFIQKNILPLIIKYRIKVACITGGEPTLHPRLPKILKIIKKTGVSVTLITNCTNLNTIFEKIESYVDGYMLPLDSDNDSLYYEIRGVNNFHEVISWPRKIKECNPSAKVIFSCLVQKKNISKLVNIYLLASKLPIDGIVFKVPELRPYCFGRSNFVADETLDNAYLTRNDILNLRKEFRKILILDHKKKILLQKKDVFERFIKYFEFLRGKKINFEDKMCKIPFNSITIDELKNIRPCFYLPFFIPFSRVVKDPINNFYLRSIREKLLKNERFRKENCSYCFQFQY